MAKAHEIANINEQKKILIFQIGKIPAFFILIYFSKTLRGEIWGRSEIYEQIMIFRGFSAHFSNPRLPNDPTLETINNKFRKENILR